MVKESSKKDGQDLVLVKNAKIQLDQLMTDDEEHPVRR